MDESITGVCWNTWTGSRKNGVKRSIYERFSPNGKKPNVGLEDIQSIPNLCTPSMRRHVHLQEAADVGENRLMNTSTHPSTPDGKS